MNNLYLAHHGIKGQRWGVRRYQNPDGSLTDAGYRKYYNSKGKITVAGRMARSKASRRREVATGNTAQQVAISGLTAAKKHKFYSNGRKYVSRFASQTLYNMSLKGASSKDIRRASNTFVAAIGALTISEIKPHAKLAYTKVRYAKDKDYKTMLDARADMKDTIRSQKSSTAKRLNGTSKSNTQHKSKRKLTSMDARIASEEWLKGKRG